MKYKILIYLLGLLGVTACNKETCQLYPPAPMYGTPSSTFTIKGRVTDAEGTPINGIHVTPVAAWKPDESADRDIPNEQIQRDSLYASPVQTTEAGTYTVENECVGRSSFHITLRIEDRDGAANGGQFVTKEVDIKITDSDQTESGSWNSRYNKQASDIVMDQAKNE